MTFEKKEKLRIKSSSKEKKIINFNKLPIKTYRLPMLITSNKICQIFSVLFHHLMLFLNNF